eukprot:scaffold1175_cov248-Pinguiococcus_pyrenoidosus.AAC.1
MNSLQEVGYGSVALDEVFEKSSINVSVPLVDGFNETVAEFRCRAAIATEPEDRSQTTWIAAGIIGLVCLTNVTWAWGFFLVRQIIVLLLPLVALRFYATFLGALFARVVLPMLPYPVTVNELKIDLNVERKALGILFQGRRLCLRNPPGYPHEHVLVIEWFHVLLRMSYAGLWNMRNWASVGWKLDLEVGDVSEEDPPRLAVAQIEFAEFCGCHVTVEKNTWQVLNLKDLKRVASEKQLVRALGDRRRDWPNTVDICVLEARNLRNRDVLSPFADPWCQITLRSFTFRTVSQLKTLNPIWNSQVFRMYERDPSAALHLQVFDERLSGDNLIGQWGVKLRDLVKYPTTFGPGRYLSNVKVEESGFLTCWVPLWNQDFSARMGGEVKIQIRWYADESVREPPRVCGLTPFQQLMQMQAESVVGRGEAKRERIVLGCMPLLFKVHRVSFRRLQIQYRDLFSAFHDEDDEMGSQKGISLAHLEIGAEVLHKNDAFINAFQLRDRLVSEFKSRIGTNHRVLFHALETGVISFARSRFRRHSRGSPASPAGTESELLKTFFHQPPKQSLTRRLQHHLVGALNLQSVLAKEIRGGIAQEDWKKPVTKSGTLQKGKGPPFARHWSTMSVELKGQTMYYTPLDRNGEVEDWTRKIELKSTESIWIDRQNYELVLVMKIPSNFMQAVSHRGGTQSTTKKTRHFRVDPSSMGEGEDKLEILEGWLHGLLEAKEGMLPESRAQIQVSVQAEEAVVTELETPPTAEQSSPEGRWRANATSL